MTLSPLGDSAIAIALGETVDDPVLVRVRAVARAIARQPPCGVVEVVPAFASVTVFYDLAKIAGYARLCGELEVLAHAAEGEVAPPARQVAIPVVYGGEFGPDLADVARNARCSEEDVIALHGGATYRVQAIGFVPGFAYLGGLPAAIHTPRRATPRAIVPAGAVGIGGAQTGIYPLETPGGWNLIGRTPLRLFDASREPPALLRAGDEVSFQSISAEEFSQRGADFHLSSREKGADPELRRASPEKDAGIEIEVKKGGMLTTLQDVGRSGHRASGVPLSGPVDPFALRLANLLTGNDEGAAVLELTLLGPELVFSQDALVALTGAEFEGLAIDRPVWFAAGQTLRLGAARRGCRGYLAIAGGFDVPPVLGSRSTYLRAGFGGHAGRALRAGDRLTAPAVRRRIDGHWRIDERILPAYGPQVEVRVVRGAQADEFDDAFFAGDLEYVASPQSDRMGSRLKGPTLMRRGGSELRSAVVLPGTVQVPPDGQPIVLLADAQTLGGYPQAAHVIAADLPLMAQLRPGDAVRFKAVSLAQAHELALHRERALGMLREGLAAKFS